MRAGWVRVSGLCGRMAGRAWGQGVASRHERRDCAKREINNPPRRATHPGAALGGRLRHACVHSGGLAMPTPWRRALHAASASSPTAARSAAQAPTSEQPARGSRSTSGQFVIGGVALVVAASGNVRVDGLAPVLGVSTAKPAACKTLASKQVCIYILYLYIS